MAARRINRVIAFPELDNAGTRPRERGDTTNRITITTDKAPQGGKIEIRARVSGFDGVFESFMVFGDFSKVYAVKAAKRVTQKGLEAFHNETVTDALIERIKSDALAFYAANAKKFAA